MKGCGSRWGSESAPGNEERWHHGTFALYLRDTKLTVMKLCPIVIPLFGLLKASFAQPYFCEAPDSVLALYRDDADRMAVDRTFRNGSSWMDSVPINPEWAQTSLGALVALYNSTSPERDTVADLLDMPIHPIIPLRTISVLADSTVAWVHQLEQGVVPTGNSALDGLMQQNDVVEYYLSRYAPGANRSIFFTMGVNCNMLSLADRFGQVPGVVYANASGSVGDGDPITDSVHTDHIAATFGYGWLDCPAGCGARYYWDCSVQPDCCVEFIGSHGLSPFSHRAWKNPLLPHGGPGPTPRATGFMLTGPF